VNPFLGVRAGAVFGRSITPPWESRLAKIDLAILGDEPQAKRSQGDLDIPRFVKQALMANVKAWDNFRKLAPSHCRGYIQWIMDAKREETRERRLREAVSLLEQNKKLGLK